MNAEYVIRLQDNTGGVLNSINGTSNAMSFAWSNTLPPPPGNWSNANLDKFVLRVNGVEKASVSPIVIFGRP
jgi:hypothetical protein